MAKLLYVLCISLCLVAVCAKSAKEGKKSKSRRDGKLSDQDHYDEKGEHNAEFDHEAFLGKQKKSFDQLTPEESKERLGKIVDKIDKDKDGKITADELSDWIKFTKEQHNAETVNQRWKELIDRLQRLVTRKDPESKRIVDPNEAITWDEYKTASYGENPEESPVYKNQIVLERRRWKYADLDHDDKLTREEYAGMYYPWEHKHMHDAVAQENLEDIDKDKDGKVSLQEYLDELHRKDEKDMTEKELNQKKIDADYFHSHRDADKDGFLDKDEVKEWTFPTNYDVIQTEAKHLIHHADANKDKVLTKEEILDKYNIFVGSKATNYGKDLTRHDEF